MNEKLLQYIWQYKLFDVANLRDVDGYEIVLINSGTLNTNAGPDFLNAKFKINETIWAGNIEIHVKSADFFSHQHQHDESYKNLIMHVVWEHNCKLDINTISVLELKSYVSPDLLKKYQELSLSTHKIPCSKEIIKLDSVIINTWLNRLLIERIEQKTKAIEQQLRENNYNWETTFFQQLASRIATSVNSSAFELLFKQIPVSLIAKYKNNLIQIEALFYGVAGMLNDTIDSSYYIELQKEFRFLKSAHQLTEQNKSQFKFLRLRPLNFPSIRLAQLATLCHLKSNLFDKLINAQNIEEVGELLNIKASDFWNTHYTFDKESNSTPKKLGTQTINSIIINTLSPFMFLYSKLQNDDKMQDKALEWIYLLEFEINSKTKHFEELLKYRPSAAISQATIQLYDNYCSKKRCLDCAIGIKILKNE